MQENEPAAFSEAMEGILSRKEDYIRCSDPTEYSFVKKFVGSMDKWEAVVNSEIGAPIIKNWREELALKLSSEAFLRILEASRGETRDALGANKYIFEALSVKEDKPKVGRPSKDAILKEATKLVEDDKQREEIYQRIFNAV